jgi:hypothetical protein
MIPRRPELYNIDTARLHGGADFGLQIRPIQKVGSDFHTIGLAPLLGLLFVKFLTCGDEIGALKNRKLGAFDGCGRLTKDPAGQGS